ncbi:HesA/MoeB/ThiF family protein [Bowmanella dokdonensis]|uniref:Molybdopterin-synthase adenylyltransferase MoeB n=1 Tax=Bowmanella dokdonensis TaxID=751969 RepID=A0A939DPA8_9ALTE|nr:molybdopterin-synthase adenylyltransferase MoeB [Bowmanella dokdonensis]MBN7826297.1 molybdopterin-synthase adenylyltransferase MoeB [Bowmanella dokdonensis]
MLTEPDALRYGQQLLLEEVGENGQARLAQSAVLIVGLGGLGCAAAQYLAAAGVGHLTLADPDRLSLSNLQRQVLYDSAGLNQAKVSLARDRLWALNPHIRLTAIPVRLDKHALPGPVSEVDLVLDCTDNMLSRQAINAACYQLGKPLISGSAIRMEGQLLALDPALPHGCYHCLYDPQQATDRQCIDGGILGPVVGMIGLLQALEALKFLAGAGRVPWGKLKCFDAGMHHWQEFDLPANPSCPVCGVPRCN